MEESKSPEIQQYHIDQFDFGLHLNRARKLGLYEVTDNETVAATSSKSLPKNEAIKKSKDGNKRMRVSTPKHSAVNLPTTPEIADLEEEYEEEGKLLLLISNCL